VLNLYDSFRDAEHMTIALIPVQIHAINLIYYFLAGAIPSFLFKKSWICILLWIIAAIVAIIIAWLSIVLLGFSTPTRGI
jgi:hypothetical protein